METSVLPSTDVLSETKMSTGDSLRAILASLTTESATIKNLIANVRNVLKDVERQTKDYDKLVNKRSRNKGEKKVSDAPSGITKPVAISDDLAVFLGVAPGTLVPRNEVTKGVSAYVRQHELYDPTNRQKFSFANKPEGKVLFKLLGEPEEIVTYFNLQRYLKSHYITVSPTEAPVVSAVPVIQADVPSTSEPAKKKSTEKPAEKPAETPAADASDKKKKTIIKKVKKDQLTEE
jgi:chromatin remodeling complex protein RSC6